jgi:hypothetical protein
MKKYVLLCLILCAQYIYGDSASWVSGAVNNIWSNSDNWSEANFPNGAGEIACFGGYPNGGDINSGQSITIGALYINTTNALNINFDSPYELIFNNNSLEATIHIASGQTPTISNPAQLESNILISASESSSININGGIHGNGNVQIFSDPDTDINISNDNTYMGHTLVSSGRIQLNGPGSNTNIPGDITVQADSTIKHVSGISNNYGPQTQMTLNGGGMNLGGTEQTIQNIFI